MGEEPQAEEKEQRGKDHRCTGRKPHDPNGEEAPALLSVLTRTGGATCHPPGGLSPQRHRPAQGSRAPLRCMPATGLPPQVLGISWAPVGPTGHPVTQEGARGCSASEEQKHASDSHAAPSWRLQQKFLGQGQGRGWAEGLDHRKATGSWMVTSTP